MHWKYMCECDVKVWLILFHDILLVKQMLKNKTIKYELIVKVN